MPFTRWWVVIKVNRGIEFDDAGIWIQAEDEVGNIYNHAEIHYGVGPAAQYYDVIVAQANFYTTFADYAKIIEGYVDGEKLWRDSFAGHLPPFNGQTLDEWGVAVHEQIHTAEPPPPPPSGTSPVTPPPITPPVGPPVGPPPEVEIQPPEGPPETLPPYQPPKPPDHPPFKPPPKPTEPPPRVSPRETDTETFLRFLAKWGHQIEEYAVNVPLDSGLWVEQLEEPWRSLWAKLTEHKADLVFKRKGQLYVAEVKPRLSRGAIGEALVASQMYEFIYKPKQKPNPAVICMTASPILLQMAAHNGVLVFVTDFVDGSKLWGEVRTRRKMR